MAQGMLSYKHGDMQEVVHCMKKARELGLVDDFLEFFGFLLGEIGKIPEARRYAEEACTSNPLSFFPSKVKAAVNIFDGQFEKALDIFHETELRLAPEESVFYWWQAQAYAFAGKEDEARNIFKRVLNMKDGIFSDFSNLFLQAMDENLSGVQQILDSTVLKDIAETDEWFPNYLAICLIQVGEIDKALYYLDRAVNWGFSNHQFLSQHNRYLKPLHNDPRFESLLKKAKEKQDKFEV
jgi:tetratricopeptide (TPR) repeat protein